MKDKRNTGLIIGNYYRPSGSDKKAAQNAYADKDAQEKQYGLRWLDKYCIIAE